MKRAIILGSSGFLGSHLIEVLLAEGYELLAVQHKKSLEPRPGMEVLEGGISALKSEIINEWMPDVVFHCARPVLPRFKRTGRRIAAKIAGRYNSKLIDTLRHSNNWPSLVFASGSLMYGNSPGPLLETAALNPISYARQYYKGELPLLNAIEQNSYPIQLLRFPWLLGNGSWFLWFYIKMMQEKQAIPQFGDGENKMQILNVRDAANLMYKYGAETGLTGIFNMVSPAVMTQKEFLSKVEEVFRVPVTDYSKVIKGRLEKETMEAFSSDIVMESHCKKILPHHAFISLEQSLLDIRKGHPEIKAS